MFVVLTGNSAMFAAGGLLAILGAIGGLLLIVKILKDRADRRVDEISRNQSYLLKDGRASIVEFIASDRTRYAAIDFSSFYTEFEDYFMACQSFNKDRGLNYEDAIQDTSIFSQDIFDEYGRCFTNESSDKMASLLRESVESRIRLAELNLELARLDEQELAIGKPSRLSQFG